MDLQLKDDVAVVIGSASGIGRAIAETFADEGAKVVLWDIAKSVEQTAQEVRSAHKTDSVEAAIVDATDYAAVTQNAESIFSSHGRCDHVVYAAGLGSGKYGFPFWNLTPDDWPRVWQVNVMGAVNISHAFAPRMLDARRGTFLFISSVAGQIGSQTDPPYSAAKAAILNFAQCAAKDLAPYDIRVNTICPGMIKTPLNQSVWQSWHDQQPEDQRLFYDDWAEEKISRIAPLGRWQQPQDIASMAVFLASPQAKNVTGQTMNVDGGQVM